MSEGEAAHLGWVMAHPARARRTVTPGGGGLYRPKRQMPRFTCNLGEVNGGEPLHSDETADQVDDLQSLVLGVARA